MMVKLFLFVGLLCSLGVVRSDLTTFCEEQRGIFERASKNIGKQAIDGEDLCGPMETFLSTAYDTNATCHEQVPDMNDAGMQAAVTQVKLMLETKCPHVSVSNECSDDVTTRLMHDCNNLANAVRMGQDSSHMCQMGSAYIHCLETINRFCSGSRALIRADLHANIASSRASMRAFCPTPGDADRMQGDQPVGGSPLSPSSTRVCTLASVNAEVTTCTRALSAEVKDSSAQRCRALHSYLLCVDRIRTNCPSVPLTGYQSLLDSYHTTCGDSFVTCPSEVLDQTYATHAYCLNEAGNVEENSAGYCRKMTQLANCLSSLRDVCPVAHDNDRIGHDLVASGVDQGLEMYCQ